MGRKWYSTTHNKYIPSTKLLPQHKLIISHDDDSLGCSEN